MSYNLENYLDDMMDYPDEHEEDGDIFMSQGGVKVKYDSSIQWYRLLEDFDISLKTGDIMPSEWGIIAI